MKKTTINVIAIVILLALGSCAKFKPEDFNPSAVPNPLEMHGNSETAEKQVAIRVDVNFPPKSFPKKAYLLITPSLVSIDGSKTLPLETRTIQGEKVQDNNEVIPFQAGGSYSYKDTVVYDPAFRNSKVVVKVSARKKPTGTSVDLELGEEEYSITGIITTPELVDEGLKIDNGTVGNTNKGMAKTVKANITQPASSNETKPLTLYYEVKKTNLNSKEEKKSDIDTFVQAFKAANDDPDKEFVSFSIEGYASPEGEVDMNKGLVEGRGDNSKSFLTEELSDAGVEEASEENFTQRKATPDEDWAGFQEELQKSTIAQNEKDMIIQVLNLHKDPDVREKEIRNMSSVYGEIEDEVFPQLRRAEVYATFKTRQKTVQELITLGKTTPEAISQQELFFASQESEAANKETLYKNYIKLYPGDWKANNNLAVYYIGANKLDDADTYLQNAEDIDDNNATINNNFGVLYWAKGDLDKAEEYFNKAKAINSTDDIGYNLGVIQIKKGKYSDAVVNFGNSESFNKSLAELLAGSGDAQATLDKVESEAAYYYYLQAVLAARAAEEGKVFENLQEAVKADASIKDYAKNDLEFREYFENATFKGIVN